MFPALISKYHLGTKNQLKRGVAVHAAGGTAGLQPDEFDHLCPASGGRDVGAAQRGGRARRGADIHVEGGEQLIKVSFYECEEGSSQLSDEVLDPGNILKGFIRILHCGLL